MRRLKGLPEAVSQRAHLGSAGAMPVRFGRAAVRWLIPKEFPSCLSEMSGSKLGADNPHHAIGRADCSLGKGGETPPVASHPVAAARHRQGARPRHLDEGLAPSTRLMDVHV